MDDRFLHEARREPPPAFAAGLKARLDHQGIGAGEARVRAFRPGLALAAGFVVLAAGALIAFPSVRAQAQAFLDLFRVRNFTAIPFDSARMDKLQAIDQKNGLMVFERKDMIREPGPPQVFPTPEAAGAVAGIDVRRPSFLPSGLALDTVVVEGPGEARLTTSETKLRALLDQLDLNDVQVPPGLGGQEVTVRKPPIVFLRYTNGRTRMTLVQARSPEVTLPSGVDLARLGEIGLRILGLDAAEARRIATSIDWHSTLVIPVPIDASSFRHVTVRGNPGLLITTRESTADGKRRREGTVVMWTEGDRVFGLMSTLGGPDLVQVAESVH